MCRRGGSKGGKHPDDVTDINVGNTERSDDFVNVNKIGTN